MPQSHSQRVVYLDLLRLIASFAVVFLHVCCTEFQTCTFSNNWYIVTIGDGLVRWCVPVFVMISGSVFLNPAKEITIRSLFVKYIPRLLLCYVFWTIVYYFLFSYNGDFSITKLVKSHFHLWFLRMLVCLYVLIPALRLLAKDVAILRYCLGIWIVYMVVSSFNLFEIFNMNSIVGFSGYFLLGLLSFQQSLSKKQRIWVYVLGVLGAVVTVGGTLYVSIKQGEANDCFFGYLNVHVAAMALAVFVFVKEKTPKNGKVISRVVDFVRKDLFGIYLTHALWLPVVNTDTIRHCCSEIITLPVISIVVFILSLFTTKLIRMIPYLRKVVE